MDPKVMSSSVYDIIEHKANSVQSINKRSLAT